MQNNQKVIDDFLKTGDVLTVAKYFINYDYVNKKNDIDEWIVKSILVISKKHSIDILYNFIIAIYKDQYDLSEFIPNLLFPITNKNITSVTNCYTKKFSGGIGDFLRGSMYLYDLLCADKNVPVNIDFKQHPIGRFVLTMCPVSPTESIDLEIESEKTRAASNWSLHMKETLHNLINHTNKDLAISSFYHDALIIPNYEVNAKCYFKYYNPSDSCKRFFKHNIYFDRTIEDLFNDLQITDYHVLHFRLGDRHTVSNLDEQINKLPEFIQKNKNYIKYDHDYSVYHKIIKDYLRKRKCKNLIVMSDSNDFKSYIEDTNKSKKIHVIHTKSTHTSYAPSTLTLTDFQNADIEEEKLMYTALDIKILSESKNNTSYSVYNWGSGFVYWVSKIFDVPCRINTF